MVTKLQEKILKSYMNKANMALEEWKEYAERISPTDTGEYKDSFKVNKMRFTGDAIVGSLENDSDHAVGVETGFRKEPVNWHKGPPRTPSTRIYRGVGARVQTRTVDALRKQTLQRIFG